MSIDNKNTNQKNSTASQKNTKLNEVVGDNRQHVTDELVLAETNVSLRSRCSLRDISTIGWSGKKNPWGITRKIVVATIGLLILLIFISALFIYQMFHHLQVTEVKKDALLIANSLKPYAVSILKSKYKFDKTYENSQDKQGDIFISPLDYWLYQDGFIDLGQWLQLVNKDKKNSIRKEDLDSLLGKAEILKDVVWLDSDISNIKILYIYILDQKNHPLASNVIINQPLSLTLPEQQHDQLENSNYYFDMSQDKLKGKEEILYNEKNLTIFLPLYDNSNALSPPEFLGTIAVAIDDSFTQVASGRMLYVIGVIVLAMLALAVVIYSLIFKFFIAPLHSLANNMQRMLSGELKERLNVKNNDEIGEVAENFNLLADALQQARKNHKEITVVENELLLARNIQFNLLPKQMPIIKGIDLSAAYRPAKQVSGDYYDFLSIDHEHMGIIIGDVSGKSMPAALIMATIRGVTRFVAPGNLSAANALCKINDILAVDIPTGMFITAYYLILDPLRNNLLYASAGHNSMILSRADGSLKLLNPGGIALGFDKGQVFNSTIREQKLALQAGDRIVLYTDGVIECLNSDNEEYSEKRLHDFVRQHQDLPSADFTGALLADLDRYRGTADVYDDVTIVTFKVL